MDKQSEIRNPQSEIKNNNLSILLIILLALIWGSSFILMKRGLAVFSSEEVAALRIVIAAIVLIPLAITHIKKIEIKKNWPYLVVMGLFGNLIPAFLFTESETGISSALAGMLNALTPLFTLILGILFFKTKTKWINAVGVLVGFAGAVLLFLANREPGASSKEFMYAMMVVSATLCYAISINTIRKHLTGIPAIGATAFAFLFMLPAAAYFLMNKTFVDHVQLPQANTALMYISILAIVGTAFSVILFNVLVRITDALVASSVTYLIPIVAIAWGLFDGEKIYPLHYIGILVILAGVYLVNRKSKT